MSLKVILRWLGIAPKQPNGDAKSADVKQPAAAPNLPAPIARESKPFQKHISPRVDYKQDAFKFGKTIRFVALANSVKEGGRCIAGVVLTSGDSRNPKLWVRPISSRDHGQIDNHYAKDIACLKIYEFTSMGHQPDAHQPENVLCDQKFKCVSDYSGSLDQWLDQSPLVFGDRRRAISQDCLDSIGGSLEFRKVKIRKIYTNDRGKLRISLFTGGASYDLPLTDPLYSAKNVAQYAPHAGRMAYVTFSLGVPWNNEAWKLAAWVRII